MIDASMSIRKTQKFNPQPADLGVLTENNLIINKIDCVFSK
jgi:hypothetical protein